MAEIVIFQARRKELLRLTGLAGHCLASYTQAEMSKQLWRPTGAESRFFVDDWLVSPSLNRVVRDEVAVQLSFKAMALLICLAERAGEVVGKRELVDAVWQTEYVADNTLTRRVAELRDAFGDDARNPRYIETITKRGYRVIAEVRALDDAGTVAEVATIQTEPVEGSPYPGLEPFTEEQAEDFFGRDAEIAALWRKIAGRRLLAVIGPSGAGKSSLLRAGVIPHAPPGWRAVICQPGEEPFLALARALAPDLAGNAEEMRQLLAFHEPDVALAVAARWRGRFDEALVVVDQFEELFTLNPEPVRERFAELLRRLVDAAGTHVVLALRDDFLIECNNHPQLVPIFADLTPVGAPSGPELRRALTEPAARRLHAFESQALVDEMVSEVEDERGALPLLAFAVSRLWELRDRERRMLTRSAFEKIGGVGGALAQHAEATLEVIGHARLPVVRELFRNLVTAQRTRAVRDVDDLLSIFDESDRDQAASVLDALVDARLLTSFEDAVSDEEACAGTRRVEIVHESLLKAWPRLVRWQTQDADAAQLRDQLRQAARLWNERDRPGELLWAGTPYRELMLWRESYPGSLTATEQDFVDATIRQTSRRRRRRRMIGAGVVAGLALVAAALAGLWLRSERQARRIEARRLEEIAQQTMAESPPNALAFALAGLEIMDSHEARRLALGAVWSSPMPLTIGRDQLPDLGIGADFSPDGRWLSVGHSNGELALWPRDGGPPSYWRSRGVRARANFTPDSEVLLSRSLGSPSMLVWSVPDLRELGMLERGGFRRSDIDSRSANVQRNLRRLVRDPEVPGGWRYDLWALDRAEALADDRLPGAVAGPAENEMVIALGNELQLHSSTEPMAAPRVLARFESPVDQIAIAPDGGRLATFHGDGGVRLSALGDGVAEPLREWPRIRDGGCNDLRFGPSGARFVVGFDAAAAAVLGVDDPPQSDPMMLLPNESRLIEVEFHPSGDWLATASMLGVSLWPLHRKRTSHILRGHAGDVEYVDFLPDGRSLVSQSSDGTVRMWPLEGATGSRVQVLHDWGHPAPTPVGWMTLSPDGRFLVTTCNEDVALVVPLDGSAPKPLGGFDNRVLRAAVGGEGRLIAIPGRFDGGWIVREWDLETETSRDVDLSDVVGETEFHSHIQVTADGRLLVAGSRDILYEIDPVTGSRTLLADGAGFFIIGREDDLVVSRRHPDPIPSVAIVHNLTAGTTTRLASHGDRVISFALDSSGSVVVTGSSDGIIRVGPVSGEAPHWLVGHEGTVWAVAISPDGKTIASGGSDGTIRIWPMPDLSKPPLHDLPRDEFLARLGSLINRRVIRDPDDPEGYRIKVDPFPGWATVPEW